MHSRLRRATFLVGASFALATMMSGAALAQDPTDAPESPAPVESLEPVEPCGILSAEEVSAAFGEPFTLASGDPTDCGFDGDFAEGRFISVFTDLSQGSVEEISDIFCPSPANESPAPDATTGTADASLDPDDSATCIDETIAGRTAVYMPDMMGTLMYIDVGDGGLFNLQLVGDPVEGVDQHTALVAIAELALPRLPAVSDLQDPEETLEPEPTYLGDAALAALFPSEIDGAAFEVETRVGTEAELDPDDPTAQAFLTLLEAQGKTIDDLSIGIGYSQDYTVSITAIQIHGSDIATLAPQIVAALMGDQESTEQTVEVGGKQVTETTVNDEATYIYTHGDVLWLVYADEPALTEVFQKLP